MIFLTELEKNHEIHMEAQKTPKTSKKKKIFIHLRSQYLISSYTKEP